MKFFKAILFTCIVQTTLTPIEYISNSVIASQSDLSGLKSAFGPVIGLSVNETGNVN
jgi:hypothetical protein